MLDVNAAVSSVYALADLERRTEDLRSSGSPRAWHMEDELMMLQRETHNAFIHEASLLARAFRDYIVLTSVGEARHARLKCDYHWFRFPTSGHRRDLVWLDVKKYTVDSLLREAIKLYECTWQRGGYGGTAWLRIIKSGSFYGTMPDSVFLDHVVDLTHNSGLYLNKGVIFYALSHYDSARYLKMLTFKTEHGLLYPARGIWPELEVFNRLLPLFKEGRRLDVHRASIKSMPNPEYEHNFVTWGTEVFAPRLVSKRDTLRDDTFVMTPSLEQLLYQLDISNGNAASHDGEHEDDEDEEGANDSKDDMEGANGGTEAEITYYSEPEKREHQDGKGDGQHNEWAKPAAHVIFPVYKPIEPILPDEHAKLKEAVFQYLDAINEGDHSDEF